MSRATWRRARLGALAVLMTAAGLMAHAFQESGFVPVKPGAMVQETLPATPLVFTAYAFVWVALAGYVLLLWRRVSRVQRELTDVRSKLQGGKRA